MNLVRNAIHGANGSFRWNVQPVWSIGFDVREPVEDRPAGRLVRRIDDVFQAVFHILRRQRSAVVEQHVVAQVERIDECVGGNFRHCLGELWLQVAVDVEFDEVFENRFADDFPVVAGAVDRIAGNGVGRQRDGQRAGLVGRGGADPGRRQHRRSTCEQAGAAG